MVDDVGGLHRADAGQRLQGGGVGLVDVDADPAARRGSRPIDWLGGIGVHHRGLVGLAPGRDPQAGPVVEGLGQVEPGPVGVVGEPAGRDHGVDHQGAVVEFVDDIGIGHCAGHMDADDGEGRGDGRRNRGDWDLPDSGQDGLRVGGGGRAQRPPSARAGRGHGRGADHHRPHRDAEPVGQPVESESGRALFRQVPF